MVPAPPPPVQEDRTRAVITYRLKRFFVVHHAGLPGMIFDEKTTTFME